MIAWLWHKLADRLMPFDQAELERLIAESFGPRGEGGGNA